MKTIYNRIFIWLLVLTTALTTACTGEATDNEEPLPEGMGRIRVTICSPEKAPGQTRAVNAEPWEVPDHEWEKLQTFRILICDADNKVVQIIEGDKSQMGNTSTSTAEHPYQSATVTSTPLSAGNYYIYATANYADGYTIGSTVNPNATIRFANGYSESDIPMTGYLPSPVTVNIGEETDAGTISVWRVMGKLQFEFTNETNEQVDILGIEVDPINQASSTGPGIYLFSKDDLTSTNNLVPLFPANATKNVSATWSLNTTPTQNMTASVSMGGVFESTALSWSSKLDVTGGVSTYDNVYTLQKFKTTENITSKDDAVVITMRVTPKSGMTFTPKNISFKACRVGTNGGKFDVEAGGTALATEVTPPRSNGDDSNHVPPFYQEYSYAISGTPTNGEYVVKIYLYALNQKEYAFRDIVISGDVTNNTGSPIQEHITLPAGATTDVGPVRYEPSTALALNASGGTGNLFFYVNETDASFTNNENQFSLRFKVRRNGQTEELRYGMTTPYIDGRTGGDGFNVIRRNDWIHIPIRLTDWQFRIEPLAFVPIAGYPATTLSSDALSATFSTGGPIILQPFVKKRTDSTWRDFSNTEVTFVSVSWKNDDGNDVSGIGKIFTSQLTYDTQTHCIYGVLNNSLATGTYMTTVIVNTKLGPSGSQLDYSFTFNVVLKK